MGNLLGQRNDRVILHQNYPEIIVMLKAFCVLSVCCLSLALSACGQTGALQLPSDPNYDHRAKYLLYPAPAASQSQPVTAP